MRIEIRFPLCYRSTCFVLILLSILLTAVYVCECVHVRVLITTEGKRRSSDVTQEYCANTHNE